MTETKQPAVYGAIAEILKGLSVEKNGTLPSNLGGKPYITAVDLNLEIKRRFVEQDLILVPHEKVFKHEVVVGTKITNIISVEGSYDVISTVDGSSLTISGTGDGLSTGSSVASNIASTNALKNAFLRFFLVTEQSTEDASKAEQDPGAVAPPVSIPTGGLELDPVKRDILALLKAHGSVDESLKGDALAAKITELGNEFFDGRPGWNNALPALQKWKASLESGEVK